MTLFENLNINLQDEPNDNDVCCGRGGATFKHPGNRVFRGLISMNKVRYATSSKTAKLLLAENIVKAIRSQSPPGRFLEYCTEFLTWQDIGDKRAIQKTSQALREGQPMVLRNMERRNHDLLELDMSSVSSNSSSSSSICSSFTSSCPITSSSQSQNTKKIFRFEKDDMLVKELAQEIPSIITGNFIEEMEESELNMLIFQTFSPMDYIENKNHEKSISTEINSKSKVEEKKLFHIENYPGIFEGDIPFIPSGDPVRISTA